MADFPRSKAVALPLFLSTFGQYGFANTQRIAATGASLGSVTWVSNLIAYMPVAIPFAYPVNRVWWVNGGTIASTSADFGIYTLSGGKVFSTGATAMSGASGVQYVTPGTKFVLAPGQYYFAWTCNNTTARAFGWASIASAGAGRLVGLLQEAGSGTLPAAATFASWAQTFGGVACGVTRTPSGF